MVIHAKYSIDKLHFDFFCLECIPSRGYSSILNQKKIYRTMIAKSGNARSGHVGAYLTQIPPASVKCPPIAIICNWCHRQQMNQSSSETKVNVMSLPEPRDILEWDGISVIWQLEWASMVFVAANRSPSYTPCLTSMVFVAANRSPATLISVHVYSSSANRSPATPISVHGIRRRWYRSPSNSNKRPWYSSSANRSFSNSNKRPWYSSRRTRSPATPISVL